MIVREKCGCVSDERGFIPNARHPQLRMCDLHRAAWHEIHQRAARDHLGIGPLQPEPTPSEECEHGVIGRCLACAL